MRDSSNIEGFEQVGNFAGDVRRMGGGMESSDDGFQSDILSKILRVGMFFVGTYLLFQGSNLFLQTSNWGFIFQNPSFVFSSFFGLFLSLAAIIPKKFVKNESEPDYSSDEDNFFISIEEESTQQVKRKQGISWEISSPKNLPNPLINENSNTFDFLIELEIVNNTKESLNLEAEIESLNQGIALLPSDEKEEWKWLPIPHHETSLVALKDEKETNILGKGQSTKIQFHAVYRPKFSVPFFPGYLTLHYRLRGEFEAGEEFRSGLQRIELPFVDGGGN